MPIQRFIGSVANRLRVKLNLSDLDDRQAALDNLTDVASATDEHVLTKDTSTGEAIFKVASGVAGGGGEAMIDCGGWDLGTDIDIDCGSWD